MHQLPHQLVLELPADVLTPDRDSAPGIAAGQDAVRVPDILILDRERVGGLAPLSFLMMMGGGWPAADQSLTTAATGPRTSLPSVTMSSVFIARGSARGSRAEEP